MEDKMLELSETCAFERALSFAVGEEKAHEATERLLDRYGSFATAFSASLEELTFVGDINRNTALFVKLMAYLNSRRVTERFVFGREYSELALRKYITALFLGSSVETVYALLLDDEGRVIATEHISDGTVNSSDVVPRKILECARRRGSRNIILAHNHPKGSAQASKDDLMTTGRLFNLFAGVGVRLVAHYVVADGEISVIDLDMLYNPEKLG